MELSLLADNPSAIATVATWYFEQWCSENSSITKDFIIDKVSAATNREHAPLIVLAKISDEFVGAIELKIREMDIYPEYEFWIGGVYVAESARGKGVASALVKNVLLRARNADIEKLYLQTEDLTGGLYSRHGFLPIEQTDYKGHRVLVMTTSIETLSA